MIQPLCVHGAPLCHVQARDQELNTARSEISNRDNLILELQKRY